MVKQETLLDAASRCATVIGSMREVGVTFRINRTSYAMLWKPKFPLLPEDVQAGIREHKLDLCRLLVPLKQGSKQHRPLWVPCGGIKACACCGEGCLTEDPLGEVRHKWCGYLDQDGVNRKPTLMTSVQRKLRRQG